MVQSEGLFVVASYYSGFRVDGTHVQFFPVVFTNIDTHGGRQVDRWKAVTGDLFAWYRCANYTGQEDSHGTNRRNLRMAGDPDSVDEVDVGQGLDEPSLHLFPMVFRIQRNGFGWHLRLGTKHQGRSLS